MHAAFCEAPDRATLKRMPRTRSGDKRAAILEAAVTVIAERGLAAAPTSAISREAGVAEGTLFTYFPTKPALADALYRDLKLQIAEAISCDTAPTGSIQALMQHMWNGYIVWGAAHPNHVGVLAQLSASGMLAASTIAEASAPFAVMERAARAAIRSGELRRIPFSMLAAVFEAMAQTTLQEIARGTGSVARLRRVGFEMLWRSAAGETSSEF
jgi:AcrR family transcriptional regulator